jgi:hypothetical protein
MDKLFDVLTEEFHLHLSPSTGNEKKQIIEDENLQQPTVKVEIKLTRETQVHEQKSTNEKQNRTRTNSANNQNPTTTVADNDNR